jgi:hypothetical protein
VLKSLLARARRIDGPSFALAVVATCVALGGTAIAAKMITGKQIKNDSLTGKDIKNGSIGGSDLSGSAAGERGPQGPEGPAGPVNVVQVQTSLTTVGGNGQTSLSAPCPASAPKAIGGGFTGGSFSTGHANSSRPSGDGTSWRVAWDNTTGGNQQVSIYAICTSPANWTSQTGVTAGG